MDILRNRLRTAQTNGEVMRARIVLETARALSRGGYHSGLVREVCTNLDIARGSFYKHFANRNEVVSEVLDGFCNEVYEQSIGLAKGKGDYERIFEVTHFYARLYKLNKGLFGVQYQLARSDQFESKGWQELQVRWRTRLARYIQRVGSGWDTDRERSMTLAFMLTALADDLLYRLIFEEERELRWLRDSPDRIAEVVSVVWYRAIFGKDP